MGSTGKVEVSASEKEDGKWINASCRAYMLVDGEVDTSDNWYIGPQKKKPGSKQLPVGKYQLKCSYNAFKKEVPFEVKAGETTKVHVVMGSTGKVEVSASEKEDGKWINAGCRAYRLVDGEVDTSDNWYIGPQKKKPGSKQLPVGKYQLKCSYNAFKKEVPFEVKAGETTKVHIVFSQIALGAKCSRPKDSVNYEIYAPNGRMVYSKKVECSRLLKIPLDNGAYTLEASQGDTKKKVKFSIGEGKQDNLIVDFTNHDDEIKADSPSM